MKHCSPIRDDNSHDNSYVKSFNQSSSTFYSKLDCVCYKFSKSVFLFLEKDSQDSMSLKSIHMSGVYGDKVLIFLQIGNGYSTKHELLENSPNFGIFIIFNSMLGWTKHFIPFDLIFLSTRNSWCEKRNFDVGF